MFHSDPKQLVTWVCPTAFFAVHPTTKINIQDFEAAVAGKTEHKRELSSCYLCLSICSVIMLQLLLTSEVVIPPTLVG